MNRYHTVAIALVGWYFMMPPETNFNAPFSRWTQISVSDNPADCMKVKRAVVEYADKQHIQVQKLLLNLPEIDNKEQAALSKFTESQRAEFERTPKYLEFLKKRHDVLMEAAKYF